MRPMLVSRAMLAAMIDVSEIFGLFGCVKVALI